MSVLHRLLAAVLPDPRWVEAHRAEFATLSTRGRRLRWVAGLPLVFSASLATQLAKRPSSFVGGVLMKTVLATLSITEVAAGAALLVYAIATDPLGAGPFAVVLLVQGGYTLALLSGWLDAFGDRARHLQLVGSTLALVVGLAGFVAGVVRSLDTADPEYAPMTVLLVVVLHGLASLATFVTPRGDGDLARSGS